MIVHPPGSERYIELQRQQEVLNQQQVHNEVSIEELKPLTYDETEQKVHDLWASGAKMEAMEVVLGRPIYSDDLVTNPDLATVFTQPTADEAFGAMLLIKSLEGPKSVEVNPNE
jgi:hypothetical protein